MIINKAWIAIILLASVSYGLSAQALELQRIGTGDVVVGEVFTVVVVGESGTVPIRGGAADLRFDPEIFQIEEDQATGDFALPPAGGSPLQLMPPPYLSEGRLEIPMIQPDFELNAIPGAIPLAQVRVRALKTAENAQIMLAPDTSRLAPNVETARTNLSLTIVPNIPDTFSDTVRLY